MARNLIFGNEFSTSAFALTSASRIRYCFFILRLNLFPASNQVPNPSIYFSDYLALKLITSNNGMRRSLKPGLGLFRYTLGHILPDTKGNTNIGNKTKKNLFFVLIMFHCKRFRSSMEKRTRSGIFVS